MKLINLIDDQNLTTYWQTPEDFISSNFDNDISQEDDGVLVIEPPKFNVPYTSLVAGSLILESYAYTVWYSGSTIYVDNNTPKPTPRCLGLARIYTNGTYYHPIRENDIFVLPYPNLTNLSVIDLYGNLSTSNVYTYNTTLLTATGSINVYLGKYRVEDSTNVDTVLRCIQPFEYQTEII